jgi:hypothetical protein
MCMPTAALIESAAKIVEAQALIESYQPIDPTIHAFRGCLQSAHQDAIAGTGPFDEIHLLDTLSDIADDWMQSLERFTNSPEQVKDSLLKLQWDVYARITEARNPLKMVRNSYRAFDPRPPGFRAPEDR